MQQANSRQNGRMSRIYSNTIDVVRDSQAHMSRADVIERIDINDERYQWCRSKIWIGADQSGRSVGHMIARIRQFVDRTISINLACAWNFQAAQKTGKCDQAEFAFKVSPQLDRQVIAVVRGSSDDVMLER